jgi:predicted NBD/HSP70 family sugar kinase
MSSQSKKYVLGLHIGVSSRHAAIADLSGKVLFRNYLRESYQERSNRDYEYLRRDAVEAIRELVSEAKSNGIGTEAIVGGGVVVPASVDPIHGYVRMPPHLRGLQNTYLARDLEQGVKDILGRVVRFFVESDGNGMALAESYFGAARHVPDFVAVVLSTGLGGGLFLDGALRHGHTFMAGEIGHSSVQPNGPLCPCGSRGCLETLVSGRALLRAAHNSASPLAGRDNVRYADLIDAAERKDEEILGLFRTMGIYLGIGIANVVNTLNPSKVILTGQLASAAKFFFLVAEHEMRLRVFPGMDCDLALSGLGDDWEVLAGLGTYTYYSDKKDVSHGDNSS